MNTATQLRGMIEAAITDNDRAADECEASAADLERQAAEYRETAAGYRREAADLRAMMIPANSPPTLPTTVKADAPVAWVAPGPTHHLPRKGGPWETYARRFEATWPQTCRLLLEHMASNRPIPAADVYAMFPGRPVPKRDNELAGWLHRHGWHRTGAVFQPYAPGTAAHHNWRESVAP
jgi:hypothetical protein